MTQLETIVLDSHDTLEEVLHGIIEDEEEDMSEEKEDEQELQSEDKDVKNNSDLKDEN